jgi:4-aminobutyrate aminotransferase-like enzyme
MILLTCGVSGNVVRFPYLLTTPDVVFKEGLKILEGAIREV